MKRREEDSIDRGVSVLGVSVVILMFVLFFFFKRIQTLAKDFVVTNLRACVDLSFP